MASRNFTARWKKKREKGIFIYILQWTVLIPIGSFIGKTIGEYFATQAINISLSTIDTIALSVLSILGACLGLFSWKSNEKKYFTQK